MASLQTDAFFKLLQSSLFGCNIKEWGPLSADQWENIYELAKQQTVLALVSQASSKLPADMQPPAEVYGKMMQTSLRVLRSNQLLDSVLADVSKFLQSSGVHAVVLKGQGIARNYPEPQLRQCGDIDVYVGKRQYKKVIKAVFDAFADNKEDWVESNKHFEFKHRGVAIEIHRKAANLYMPIVSSRFQQWVSDELDDPAKCRRLTINGVDVIVPSVNFDALFIFYHAWNHMLFSGIGFRQLSDWALVLHKYKDVIDRVQLKKLLKRFHLMKPWETLGYIIVDKLGLPAEEMPFYDPNAAKTAPLILEKILTGGNFGFYDEKGPFYDRNNSFIKRKLKSLRRVLTNYTSVVGISPAFITCYYGRFLIEGTVNFVRQAFSKHR